MTFITYGERRGIEIGQARGLLQAVTLGLELKFGAAGNALLPEIQQITDPALLQSIVDRIRTADTVEEVRAVYAERWGYQGAGLPHGGVREHRGSAA